MAFPSIPLRSPIGSLQGGLRDEQHGVQSPWGAGDNVLRLTQEQKEDRGCSLPGIIIKIIVKILQEGCKYGMEWDGMLHSFQCHPVPWMQTREMGEIKNPPQHVSQGAPTAPWLFPGRVAPNHSNACRDVAMGQQKPRNHNTALGLHIRSNRYGIVRCGFLGGR